MGPMLFIYASILALIVWLIPAVAYAWGPGTHVETAMMVLNNLDGVAPQIAEVISRFPEAFIYGAASPDIIVGKKYAGYLHHCHNWRMGRLILEAAKNERQRAAAYGYLMHLAADIVAHNYYIPVKIVRSYGARMLSHTYWEMRFDLGVPDEAWERLGMVTEIDIKEFDEILEAVLRKTLFSFSTNKKIFNTILIVQKMRSLRKSLNAYARKSRFSIDEINREHYAALTNESTMGFMANPDDAACLVVDPAGIGRLEYAKNLRKRMRSMIRREIMDVECAEKLVELVKERLAVGLYRPEMELPDVVDVL
jgi:Zinc dependent phospholipase C